MNNCYVWDLKKLTPLEKCTPIHETRPGEYVLYEKETEELPFSTPLNMPKTFERRYSWTGRRWTFSGDDRFSIIVFVREESHSDPWEVRAAVLRFYREYLAMRLRLPPVPEGL